MPEEMTSILSEAELFHQLEKEIRYLSGNQQYLLLEKEQDLPYFESEEEMVAEEPPEIPVSEPPVLEPSGPEPEQAAVQVSDKDPLETATNLDSLRIRIHNCEKCNLSQERKTIVFGQGNRQSDIMFIGEGPGEEEDRQGQPFVGKAGKLLTQIIHSIGMNRDAVYITNAVKCRPPANRNPKAQELDACFPILNRQIHFIDPKLIVTLGNIAMHQLIPEAPGIMKARGNMYQYMGIPVLPVFHPSYLLRNPSSLHLMWEDMRRIRQFIYNLQKSE